MVHSFNFSRSLGNSSEAGDSDSLAELQVDVAIESMLRCARFCFMQASPLIFALVTVRIAESPSTLISRWLNKSGSLV